MSRPPVDPRFAPRMRELIKERGLSYRRLADLTFYAKSHLHGLATGARVPSPECAARLDEVLDAAGELAGYVPRPNSMGHEPIDGPAAVSDTGDVLRRTMLAALAGLGISQAAERLGLSALIAALADRIPDDRSVDDWHEAVWEYGHTYMTAPRAELLAELSADLATLGAIADGVTDAKAAAGLNDAAAYLAGLVAMVCTDLGYAREARHAWRLARRRADSSGARATRLWVSGQEAVLGLYCHRPLPTVLAIADRGLAGDVDLAAAGVAHLHSARAQALAQLRRADEALEALDDARAAFDRLPDTVTASTDTVFGWPERRLRHTESFVHSFAGRTADAYRAQDRALPLYAPEQAISRGQVQMHRAACMVRDGDLGAGLGHASATLAGLPAHARGQLVLTVANAVMTIVPAAERDRAAVVEYESALAFAAGRHGG